MPELVRRQQAAEPAGPAYIDVRVRRRWCEAQDVATFELVSATDVPLPTFEPGAFVDVELPNGLVRPYSLANAPHERNHYLLAILLEPMSRGGSRSAHASIQEDDHLRISSPRNAFSLHGGAIHSVLLAGGIGITPLISMAEHLWHAGSSFDLHYCFRTRERAAFLRRLSKVPYRSRVRFWCSDSTSSRRLDVNRILNSVPRLSHIYTCGPAGFMDAACHGAILGGWPSTRLHQESF